MTTKLLILGAANFAMEVADIVSDMADYEVAAFAVSVPPFEPDSTLLGKPVYWLADLTGEHTNYACLCAIGTTRRGGAIALAEQMGFRFATIVHPTARVSRTASVGEGCIVSPGVITGAHVTIGRHVIVNRGALIGHHTQIDDGCTIAPGANIGGKVTIGKRVWVGIGAIILERLNIGEQAFIGAASLVTQDVTARTKVLGVPARVIETDVKGL